MADWNRDSGFDQPKDAGLQGGGFEDEGRLQSSAVYGSDQGSSIRVEEVCSRLQLGQRDVEFCINQLPSRVADRRTNPYQSRRSTNLCLPKSSSRKPLVKPNP